MKIYSAEQMRSLDRETIDNYGIDGIVLMENASSAVKNEIINLDSIKKEHALVVCGRGNNGGDGFAVARHLLKTFDTVKIAFFDDEDMLKGDCRKNFDIIKNLCIDIISSIDEMKKYASRCDVIVDALYGFGFRGALLERDRQIVEIINSSDAYVVAVDVPSGLCADTGECEFAVKADKTVTFTGYKMAQLMFPAAANCGEVCVADIGVPDVVCDKFGVGETIDDEFVQGALAHRARNAHKGECGRVFVVGGSLGMSGAVCMSAYAAMRSGAGLVTAGVPKGINSVFEQKVTEAMSIALDEDENGILSASALDKILECAQKCDTLIIGPGMGRAENAAYILRECLAKYDKNIIIDADALYALSLDTSMLDKTKAKVVITPHHAEMARLISSSAKDVEKNAIVYAREFAKKHNVTVVLKGAYTVVAGDELLYVNNSAGNQGMATGGSGDVLSGVIGALACGDVELVKAAACAIYIHALAGDEAKRRFGMTGMLACDIADLLPEAFIKLCADNK